MPNSRHQLSIKALDRLGELERILRVIRHRGGHIDALTMQSEESTLTLNIILTTERAIETLLNQISKLTSVLSVLKVG